MQTIEIHTAQNVTIEYELAPLRDRMMAYFIDFMIFVVGYYILIFLIAAIFGLSDASDTLTVLLTWIPIIGLLAYHFLFEVLGDGRSLGKRAMGIRVVRLDGQEPSLSDYFLRAVFQIVDSLLSLGVLGSLLISSSPKHQRLGDMTANTTVIRVRQKARFELEDILNIKSADNYEVQYPEVRRLSEQDMLLIKHLLARYREHRNDAHDDAVTEAAAHLRQLLQIQAKPANNIEFLTTLIRDYIVLTR